MTPGEIKTVYTDVANKTFPEGRVMLLKRLPDDDLSKAFGAENWRVKFLDCGLVDARVVNVDQPDDLFSLGVNLSKVAGGVA